MKKVKTKDQDGKIIVVSLHKSFSSANTRIASEPKFEQKNITRGKGSYFTMIKSSINPEKITVLKVDVPTKRTSIYMKQKLIQL